MSFIAEVYLAQVAYWMPRIRYVDVFSPSYPKAVNNAVRKMVSEVKANPNLIGYYWTGTPRWDLDFARRQISDDWVSMIRRLPAPHVGKQRYVSFLREQHASSPLEFRAAYGMELGDVDTILSRDFLDLPLSNPIVHRDDYEFLRLIAREYYRVAGEAMERTDRRHLVFGDRYMLEDMPTEVLEEALPWIDVVAVQSPEVQFEREAFERIYRIARKPILICDLHRTPRRSRTLRGLTMTTSLRHWSVHTSSVITLDEPRCSLDRDKKHDHRETDYREHQRDCDRGVRGLPTTSSAESAFQGARSPSGRPQQFWQVETFEERIVLRDSAPEQVQHPGGGGVVTPERTQVEDGLDNRKERIV